MNVITDPTWEATYYQSDSGGRRPVEDPHGTDEIARVDTVLAGLRDRGMVDTVEYDHAAFDRLRQAVRQHFKIHWTSITPPMERLLFALCACRRPRTVVTTGAFCGNTVIWNVGALTGPGAVASAAEILGCEVVPEHVELANANFAAIGASADIRCQDGHQTVVSTAAPIDWLYLDATGPRDHPDERRRGKKIYCTLLEAAYDRLADGALILAHDTLPGWFAEQAGEYFELVRESGRFKQSVDVRIDEQGIEITQK
ncbi:MAG: hypothetical protein IT204_13860 [Fimbriimonadaceae bacterium]|nr:hypothetical protein [Fimbriimonadaceae bacterium]